MTNILEGLADGLVSGLLYGAMAIFAGGILTQLVAHL
jgi:hypothetical protein